jgi:RNA recognition motif-containing protein
MDKRSRQAYTQLLTEIKPDLYHSLVSGKLEFRWRKCNLSKKVYVGNLSYQATEDQVHDLFSPYGEIESIAMINDRDTGRFRGFCFVEMESEAADAAIAALDGQEIDGRNLRVNEARPREERGGSGGSRGGGQRRSSSGGQRRGGGGQNRRNDYPDSGGGSSRW